MSEPTIRAQMGIYHCDAWGNCMFVNKRLCQIFELSDEEIMGTGWMRRVHPDDRPALLRARERAISGIGTFRVQYRIERSAGQVWVEAFSTAMRDQGGHFAGRTGFIREMPGAARATRA